MKPDSELPADYKQRKAARTVIGATAQLRPQNWYNVEIRMCDLSSGGFMAECITPVAIGSYVSLVVPGIGPVSAQVRWQLGNRMGGMFVDPISLNRCEWVAEKAPDRREAEMAPQDIPA